MRVEDKPASNVIPFDPTHRPKPRSIAKQLTREAPHAELPELYVAARQALEACDELDEVKDLADKALALRVYGMQARDPALIHFAMRIQARATRKAGLLLKAIPRATGAHRKSGGTPILSRRAVAAAAGLSVDQAVTATRVANVPETAFEILVEAPRPARISELAERGKRQRPFHPKGIDPQDWLAASTVTRHIEQLVEFLQSTEPATIAKGTPRDKWAELREEIDTIEAWFVRLRPALQIRPTK